MLSTKAEYGLVALLELGAIHSSGKHLQVAEITRSQGIPERYLEQMLTTLRRGGLLHSIRGPRGGYRLARPPAEIHLAEGVDCLEGPPTASRAWKADCSRRSDGFCGRPGWISCWRSAKTSASLSQWSSSERIRPRSQFWH